MKYLILLYATYNNGTADKKSIYEADKVESAIASFHGYMSTYMKDDTVSMVTVMVINQTGGVVRTENFIRPTVNEVEAEEDVEVTE